jgi:hypothetical protein
MPPQTYFEGMLKEPRAAAKWRGLSALERNLLEMQFVEAMLTPRIWTSVEWLPNQVLRSGTCYHRFVVDLGFGLFGFAIAARQASPLILLDFQMTHQELRIVCDSLDQQH